MKIKVVDSTTVRPAAATPCTTMWISNLDMLMPANYHTLSHFFYRPTAGTANFFDAAVLREALSRALVEFYPLAGRLKRAENNRIEINCNGEGALFVAAEADGDMGDDLFVPTTELSLVPAVDYSKGISTYPIFLFQVTRFKCGGVCLGIAIEHRVTDGTSAFHFISNTWSEIARGLAPAIPPFLDRTVLSARSPPRALFPHVEYHPPPPPPKTSDDGISGQTTFSVFKLTRDQLSALKTIAAGYSTYEAVAAHLWRCLTIARGLPREDQETKLYIPVDGRSRLQPPLPQGYLGNVVFTASPILSCGEVMSSSLRHVARKVHDALARMDDEYLRSALDYLEMLGDLNAHARGASPYRSPNLGIISWARMPLYDADFGWGRPVFVGLGAVPSDGKIVLLPSPGNDGSLLCAISMKKEQMHVFEKLLYDV